MKKSSEAAYALLFARIKKLESLQTLSKHECIVQGVLDAIDANELKVHDSLPSVNMLIKELGFARETFVKAYRDLIAHGIVESKNRKGYFVISNNTSMQQKVAVVLYAYDTFQDTLVSELKANISDDIVVDLFFHHNNTETFEDIFNRINGRYTVYVVAPIENERSKELLLSISPTKLLLIDRFMDLGDDYSFVAQEFEQSALKVFSDLKPKLERYDEIVYFFRKNTAEPDALKSAFMSFLKDSNLNGRIEKKYKQGTLEKGKVYFTIHNPELYLMLKEVVQKKWVLGRDLAILAHNDDVIKEIICGGITTFSTDFARMGELAALFINTRYIIQEFVPTVLYDRQSV